MFSRSGVDALRAPAPGPGLDRVVRAQVAGPEISKAHHDTQPALRTELRVWHRPQHCGPDAPSALEISRVIAAHLGHTWE